MTPDLNELATITADKEKRIANILQLAGERDKACAELARVKAQNRKLREAAVEARRLIFHVWAYAKSTRLTDLGFDWLNDDEQKLFLNIVESTSQDEIDLPKELRALLAEAQKEGEAKPPTV